MGGWNYILLIHCSSLCNYVDVSNYIAHTHNNIEILADTLSSMMCCAQRAVPHLLVGAIHLPNGTNLLPKLLTGVIAFLHGRDAERRGGVRGGGARGEWPEGGGQ